MQFWTWISHDVPYAFPCDYSGVAVLCSLLAIQNESHKEHISEITVSARDAAQDQIRRNNWLFDRLRSFLFEVFISEFTGRYQITQFDVAIDVDKVVDEKKDA